MFKKIGTAAALSAALLFGGAFTASADAQQLQTNVHYKVIYSINGEKEVLTGEKANKLINQMLLKWNNCEKLDLINVEKQVTKQADKEEPKQEKPVIEEKAKEEQPKQENPSKEVTNKEEQSKQEQPVKEEKPAKKVTNKEQPKQEQPKQEVKQPETTAPQQPVQPQEQPKQEQTQSEQLNQFEQQVVELTNQERSKQGLAPLQIDDNLSKVAREKSRDMAANNYFSHTSPTYGSPFDMMNQFGISYRTAGENIAQGQTSPEQVVNAWMNSPGHRANILNGEYTHIGVGYVENGNHWTQMFIGK